MIERHQNAAGFVGQSQRSGQSQAHSHFQYFSKSNKLFISLLFLAAIVGLNVTPSNVL
jgi:hypothetical protein